MKEKRSTSDFEQKAGSSQTLSEEARWMEFCLAAPWARSVSVAGTFNQWNPLLFRLTKDKEGNWRGMFRIKPGQHEYRFYADGKWVDDPGAKETMPNEFGSKNAVLLIK